ncbi:MAG: hypothetical protein ACRD4G_19280, partial [Bryobacteraceae bacterium]
PRLQMYADLADNRWVLVRLEADEQYRITNVSAEGALMGVDMINELMHTLLRWDRCQNGFDLAGSVNANNDALDKAAADAHGAWIEDDIAPKLKHALKKDMGAHV